MSDSAYGEDYESSGSPGVTMHKIQKSSSLRSGSASAVIKKPDGKGSDNRIVIKHSKSSGKLERKVSFSEADPVKIGHIAEIAAKTVDTSCLCTEIEPNKPKRSKEKKEKIKVKQSGNTVTSQESAVVHNNKTNKEGRRVSETEFVDQVSAKLRLLEQKQKATQVVEVIEAPNSLDISATIKLSPKMSQRPKSEMARPKSKAETQNRPKSQQANPAITAILADLVSPGESNTPMTVRREKVASRIGSKRNSLDKQSVQTLAQDLAAECAKAYALMENSLSKLSSELGVTPFGLAPKNKVSTVIQIQSK